MYTQRVAFLLFVLGVFSTCSRTAQLQSVGTQLDRVDVHEHDSVISIGTAFLEELECHTAQDSLDRASTLTLVGMAYLNKFEIDSALSYLIPASHLYFELDGFAESLDISLGYNAVGRAYFMQGQYRDALSWFGKGLEYDSIHMETQYFQYLVKLNAQAIVYKRLGDWANSKACYLKCLKHAAAYFGDTSSQYSTVLQNLGAFYHGVHAEDSALFCIEEAWKIDTHYHRKVLKPADWLSAYINLADAYQAKGQLNQSYAYYLKAEEIADSIPWSPTSSMELYVSVKSSLSTLLIAHGQLEDAVQKLKSAIVFLKKLAPRHPLISVCLNDLAAIHLLNHEPDLARKAALEALDIQKQNHLEGHHFHTLTLNKLGQLAMRDAQYLKADSLFRKILRLRAKSTEGTGELYADVLGNLAVVKQKVKQPDSAWIYAQRASKIYNQTLHHSTRNSTKNLLTLVEVSRQLKNEMPASTISPTLFKHLAYVTRNQYVLDNQSKRQFMHSLQEVCDAFFTLLERNPKQVTVSDSLFNVVFTTKSLLLHSEVEQRRLLQKEENREYQKLYQSILNKRRSIYLLTTQNSQSNTIAQLEGEIRALERKMNTSLNAYTLGYTENASQLAKSHLTKGEVLIDILRFQNLDSDQDSYVAWIIQPDQNTEFHFLGSHSRSSALPPEGDGLPFDSRGVSLISQNAKSSGRQAPKPLRSILELLNQLETAHTVYLVPSGLFHQVNLAAQYLNSSKRVQDAFQVQMLTGSRTLLLKGDSSSTLTSPSLALFGGITYQNGPSVNTSANTPINRRLTHPYRLGNTDSLLQLPGTQKEVLAIHHLFTEQNRDVRLLMDTAATERAFVLMDGQSPDILHLATHGFFFSSPLARQKTFLEESNSMFRLSEDPMMRSGLLMANSQNAWEHGTTSNQLYDGVLTAYEISGMDLTGTSLAVLSACQTGLGEMDGSEGAFGLQRAFKMAGVRYIIMSLWAVPDYETSELMIRFYELWLNEQLPLKSAFYQAQKEMAAQYPDKPWLWAGFVLVE